MKRLALLLALAAALAPAAAEEKPPEPPHSPAEFAAAFARLDADLLAKTLAVDAAIRDAARAGRLSIGTEAYFLHLLEPTRYWFISPTPVMPQIPPRFDASPELAPINLAWAELRGEETRQIALRQQLQRQVETAAAAALEAALRTAAKPEDLQPAREFVQYLAYVAPPFPTSASASAALSLPYDSQLSLLAPAEEALAARQAGDAPRLARALRMMPTANASSMGSPYAPRTRASHSAILAEAFRNRMLHETLADETEAQARMEHALMEKKPLPELDAAAAAMLTGLERLRQVEEALAANDPRNGPQPYGANPEAKLPLTQARRAAFSSYVEAVALLGRGPLFGADIERNPSATPEFALGVEVQNFLAGLRKEAGLIPAPEKSAPARRGTAGAVRPHAIPAPAAAAPPPEKDPAFELLLQAHQQLAAIHTPAEALHLAGQLDEKLDLLPDPPTGGRTAPAQLAELTQSLRSLAVQWEEGTLAPDGAGPLPPQSQPMLALRLFALRDQTARRLGAPELTRPPLASEPLLDGLLTLAGQAAERHDWPRAFAVYEAADALFHPTPHRQRPIHAYLVGRQLEAAELYRDAARSYQQVVGEVVEHAPVAEATERLKALRAEHPDAVP